ncbi:MAG: sugar ABC transporter permease [Spirochaetes bacterium]|nr:MAG: sugar ABC transporter permease [Spirochaetota bacterium]
MSNASVPLFIQNRRRMGLLFILPAVLYLLVFLIIPIATAIVISLTKYSILSSPQFIGFKNYIRIFSMPTFWNSLQVTGLYIVMRLTGIILLSFFMALAINQNLPGGSFFQAVYFMPYVFPLAVTSIIWKLFYQPFGLIEQFTNFIGLEPIFWLTSANTALLGITITTVWSAAGYYSIIILAGLQTIPKDVLEAAEIDGANRIRRFIHIILPYLKPTIFFILVVGTINSIRGFPPFLIMTGGGPGNATRVIGLMIYEYGFVHLKMGVGSAMSVILLVIILGITLIQKKILSKGEDI